MTDPVQPGAPRAGRRGRRAALGVLDQLLFSLSNFALTIVVAREVTATAFGAFALGMAAYLLCTAVLRGFTSETLIVRFSSADDRSWRAASGSAGGVSLLLGAAAGLVLVCIGWTVSGVTGQTMLVLGVLFPGLALQDFLRYTALAAGRPAAALMNDLTQVVVQFLLVAALVLTDQDSAWLFVAAWGVGAHVAAAVGMATLRVVPLPHRFLAWFRDHGDLAGRYALDDFASQGSQQVTTFALAGLGGLRDAGAFRAAQTAFAPPSMFNLGVQGAVTPELVRALRHSLRTLRRDIVVLAVGLGLLSAAWGVVVLLIPDTWGEAALGATWDGAKPLLIYFAVAQVANGIRVAPESGLRALGAANRTLKARLVVSLIGVGFQLVGAVVAGVMGVAVATAILKPVQALVWWWQYRVASRDLERSLDGARA